MHQIPKIQDGENISPTEECRVMAPSLIFIKNRLIYDGDNDGDHAMSLTKTFIESLPPSLCAAVAVTLLWL
jgi:hypothetical protein